MKVKGLYGKIGKVLGFLGSSLEIQRRKALFDVRFRWRVYVFYDADFLTQPANRPNTNLELTIIKKLLLLNVRKIFKVEIIYKTF
jgi:hypothetical protein